MKKATFLAALFLISVSLSGQKTIFLHHSTGGGVFYGANGLPQWFSDYNQSHDTEYEIEEFSYPNSPYPWDNYPYDFWNLWVNQGQCNNNQSGIRCLDWFAEHYDVIVFKHCFPGAGIVPDNGNPLVSSDRKSIENYKLQYRALRELMDNYPDNKFIVWTLAPLHRNATDPQSAARAREFVTWVKDVWLAEDSTSHPNIFVFDFYGLAAESTTVPSQGKVNCLKYEYENDHNGSDSHPNELANATIMPLFGQAIVNAITDNLSSSFDTGPGKKNGLDIFPNPAKDFIRLKNTGEYDSIELWDTNGKIIHNYSCRSSELDISSLPKGKYFLIAKTAASRKSAKLIIQ
ncbi:MAG TPA: T9SS type A sorting domain-containing protein [Saprospiraceae bacterium]|nr:T9SS type A sorting domain-containing protein [Saprospiraceae bacterium]